MLINIAKGDAYGVGFEFVRYSDIKRYHRMTNYRKSPLMKDKNAGCYSDDTQQSMAIAELMLEDKVWDAESIANKFVAVFKRDERQAYTKGFYRILCESSSGNELLNRINGDSENNGSVMRSVPLGLYGSVDLVLGRAELQAQVTHNTKDGINGSKVVALAAYLLRSGVEKANLIQNLEEELNLTLNCKEIRRCSMNAFDTAECALALILNSSSLKEVIDKGTQTGGDVDSVLSVACGLGSMCREINDDLDGFFEDDLESGEYGKEYLRELDRKLKLKFNI